jgi:hypothetical protein
MYLTWLGRWMQHSSDELCTNHGEVAGHREAGRWKGVAAHRRTRLGQLRHGEGWQSAWNGGGVRRLPSTSCTGDDLDGALALVGDRRCSSDRRENNGRKWLGGLRLRWRCERRPKA